MLRKMESQEKTKKWADEWKVRMKKKWASMKKHAQNKKYTMACPDNKRKNKEREQKFLLRISEGAFSKRRTRNKIKKKL